VIVTGFSLSYGPFQIAHGPLVDRVGKLRVVAATLVVAAAGGERRVPAHVRRLRLRARAARALVPASPGVA
jgi:hypothetical protein